MLTIPSLMPLEGHDQKSHLYEPYNGLGSRAIISLSSRLTLALIPAGRPHLRLDIPPKMLFEMKGEVPTKVSQDLAKSEKIIQAEVERANWRGATLVTMQQLIVAGSAIEIMLDDNTIRTIRLDQFVWRRDHKGRVIECVIKELFDVDNPPEGVKIPKNSVKPTDMSDSKQFESELYTYIKMKNVKGKKTYEITRETGDGISVPSKEKFDIEDLPYLFLRWSITPGEDYGRAKVEETIADFRSLDALEKASLDYAAMAAKNFIMIKPGASANQIRNKITRMNNGDPILGDPESVQFKSFTNVTGYQIISEQISRLTNSISQAFLLLGGAQRDAERVTAVEIERDIQELESTLGGVYSTLSLELLERRTELLIESMKEQGSFPDIEKDALQATILTGLESLSRERDVGRGVQAAQIINQFGPAGAAVIKMDVILNKIMVGLGFPDAIKDEEQIKQENQQRQDEQLTQQATGPAINAAAKIAGNVDPAQLEQMAQQL
jgi:hypothetical protein